MITKKYFFNFLYFMSKHAKKAHFIVCFYFLDDGGS